MVEHEGMPSTTTENWWHMMKSKLHLDRIADYLAESKEHILEIGLYAGIGFLSGFFVKKFSNVVILGLIFIGGLIALQQFNVIEISINWDYMYSLFGIQQAPVIDDNFIVLLLSWIKINWIICLSYTIGFLIGLKIA